MIDTMQPDPQPGRYYVTAIDGPKRYFLAGPWETHTEALAQVAAVRRFAELTDPRALSVERLPRSAVSHPDGITSVLGSDLTMWQLRTG